MFKKIWNRIWASMKAVARGCADAFRATFATAVIGVAAPVVCSIAGAVIGTQAVLALVQPDSGAFTTFVVGFSGGIGGALLGSLVGGVVGAIAEGAIPVVLGIGLGWAITNGLAVLITGEPLTGAPGHTAEARADASYDVANDVVNRVTDMFNARRDLDAAVDRAVVDFAATVAAEATRTVDLQVTCKNGEVVIVTIPADDLVALNRVTNDPLTASVAYA